MKMLFVLNNPPCGTEGMYSGLRIAHAPAEKDPSIEIAAFLMAAAALVAKARQVPPGGVYNVEWMLKRVMAGHGRVLLCGTCMDERGFSEAEFMEGERRTTRDELAAETSAVDKGQCCVCLGRMCI